MVVNTKNEGFVVDSSFILSKILNEEDRSSDVDEFFDKFKEGEVSFVAPFLLKIEVANGLRSAFLRNRISKKLALRAYRSFLKLDIKYKKIDYVKVLKLAIEKVISTYDAYYLYIALNNKMELLSLDKRLIKKLD